MSDGMARVRDVLSSPEDVDLTDDLAAEAARRQAGGGADDGWMPDAGDGWDGVDPGLPPRTPEDGEEDPPEKACVDLALNDVGNGQRMVVHYGPDLQYVPRVGWFLWDGKRWRSDPDGIDVRRKAHTLADLIARETWFMTLPEAEEAVLSAAEAAEAELDELGVILPKDRTDDQILRMATLARLKAEAKEIKERRDKSIGRRLTHAKNAGNSNAIKNLMGEAAAMIARPLEDLDAAPLDVNTETGVLRFGFVAGVDDGGQNPAPQVACVDLLPHDRDMLITKMMPIAYDPAARCPRFMAFLERIQPRPEMRRFLQRWFGLSITGLTGEQKFAFLYGSGANGKSVLVDLMAKLIGDYAASAKIESITGKNRRGGGDATPDLMPMIGARFVRTSEPDDGQRLQEGLIKELTGGEPILVRALNENFVLVYPIFKLTISGNHKPEIHGGDDGIWRRVMLVPFDIQIPPEERDPDLIKKLWEERSGILNWLIAGLLEYLTHGLQVPEQVVSATKEYREDSDPLGAFLTLCCDVSGDAVDRIPSRDMTRAFAFWLEDTGGGAWSKQTIQKRLASKVDKWKSPTTGKTFRKAKASISLYEGIKFQQDFWQRFDSAPKELGGNGFTGGWSND